MPRTLFFHLKLFLAALDYIFQYCRQYISNLFSRTIKPSLSFSVSPISSPPSSLYI
nr:MAG TPA: hypothetical protein [Caudoviricetes sp.]